MALFGFLNNPWELMILGLIVLLFFGNRLPSVMRNLGRGVTEFKKGVEGIGDDESSRHDQKTLPRDEPPASGPVENK